MTITFVGAESTTNGPGGATTITINVPTGVQAGDVMLAALTGDALLISALLNNWAELDNSPLNSGVMEHHIYIKVAGDNEPASYTWDLQATSERLVGAIVAYRDVDPITPINVSAKVASSGSSTTIPSITTTVDDCMQVAMYAARFAETYLPPAGMTERYDDKLTTEKTISGSDVLLGSAGVVAAKTATPEFTGEAGAFSIALQPAVAAIVVIGGPSGLPEDIAGGFSLG